MSIFHVYFDGSCEPNPGGFASYGVHIPELNVEISESIGEGPGMTNNVAEWSGAIEGLECLMDKVQSGDKIVLTGDSQLVIRQLTGQYGVRSPNIMPLYEIAKKKLESLEEKGIEIQFKHVTRDKNTVADELSHKPLLEHIKEKGYEMCECGGIMVPRKSGKRTFLGCSHYPKCRNMKVVPVNSE